ncbi:hypothetical protein KK103_11845 [Curtobacterium flaccumfaciens pv. flaccumfaciens]|uniref:Uncharacterized protein n=1 Tax=Curtobacterium flaccumfaciens pv. flaccumfaciens TaxID=138532 RepID=A0A9Q2W4R4_9MICO|nr:hypothetical protein [Curtobacterium flaccumfaciens]MBT1542457.1 hypothetical protein [Curtobacterium flaccumfaciens pv. flaccumfaciens]
MTEQPDTDIRPQLRQHNEDVAALASVTVVPTVTVTVPSHWLLVMPCGCIDGSALSTTFGEIVRPTAESAHKMLTPRKRDRDREIKQGWTVRGATRAELDNLVELFTTKCPHNAEAALEEATQ